MNQRISVLSILLVAGLSGLFVPLVRAEPSQPNFVVIFADDLGYGDIGCYSPAAVETAHIDALAEEGFRQAALQQLEELRLALPSEIMDELDEDGLDALLEEAIAEVSLTLHAEASQ